MFTRANHWLFCWATSIQSKCWQSILLLFPHPRMFFPGGCFSLRFPLELHTHFSSLACVLHVTSITSFYLPILVSCFMYSTNYEALFWKIFLRSTNMGPHYFNSDLKHSLCNNRIPLIVGIHCCASVTSDKSATVTQETHCCLAVASDNICATVAVMWRGEHILNVSVLQRVCTCLNMSRF